MTMRSSIFMMIVLGCLSLSGAVRAQDAVMSTEPLPIAPAISSETTVTPLADLSVAEPVTDTASPASAATGVAGGYEQPETNATTSDVDVNKIDSLFFSKWEQDLLISARKGLNTRPVLPGDTGSIVTDPAMSSGTVEYGPREVVLGGIAYVSRNDWTIWLNGMRITPTAIPETIMDLKVYKDHIDLEWLDQGYNKIYPIRLRAQQKFNLDTRMFLPAD